MDAATLLTAVVGFAIFLAFLYYIIYNAVRNALRDVKKEEADQS